MFQIQRDRKAKPLEETLPSQYFFSIPNILLFSLSFFCWPWNCGPFPIPTLAHTGFLGSFRRIIRSDVLEQRHPSFCSPLLEHRLTLLARGMLWLCSHSLYTFSCPFRGGFMPRARATSMLHHWLNGIDFFFWLLSDPFYLADPLNGLRQSLF